MLNRYRRLRYAVLLLTLFLFAAVGGPTPARAVTRALIVVGLSADETQAWRLRRLAEKAQLGFLAQTYSVERIRVIGTDQAVPAKRDAILASVRALSPEAGDESWILLLGNSAMGRDGLPAFQVRGPRLGAEEFGRAVAALPGKKYVVIATAQSGGFLGPLLASPEVEAVSATADTGEINEPRFAEAWIETLVGNPYASFGELAMKATTRVQNEFVEFKLASGEHAQWIDRATQSIVEVPVAGGKVSSIK